MKVKGLKEVKKAAKLTAKKQKIEKYSYFTKKPIEIC